METSLKPCLKRAPSPDMGRTLKLTADELLILELSAMLCACDFLFTRRGTAFSFSHRLECMQTASASN